MKNDRHKEKIPQSVIQAAQSKLDEVKTLLDPWLLALTPEERRAILKLPEKSWGFTEKAFECVKKDPKYLPPFLSLESFGNDLDDAHNLWTLQTSMNQLAVGVDDTVMIARSECLRASLAVYKQVGLAADEDLPGAKTIYEELKPYASRGGRKHHPGKDDAATETD